MVSGDEQEREARNIDLTILMPCLNEAKTIEACIAKANSFLARVGVRGEVLVADNGSTDGSRELALAMHARVISVATRGYGAALRAGIRAARGRYIILGDADDSYDLSNLDEFWFNLRAGYDLVIGNRFRGGIAPGAMSMLHRVGNEALSWVGRLFFRAVVKDFHCGLRGVNRDRIAALRLSSTGMEYASEMIACATLHRYKIIEVPTTLGPTGRGGPPHLDTWRDGWRHLRLMLLLSPQWLFVYPGILFALLGAFDVAYLLSDPILIVRRLSLEIPAFVVATAVLMAGVQCIIIGVVACRFRGNYRFRTECERASSVFTDFTLEAGLVLAGVSAIGGLAGVVCLLAIWGGLGLNLGDDPLFVRVLVPSLIGLLISVQLTVGSFLLGVLDLAALRDGQLDDEWRERSADQRAILDRSGRGAED